MNRLNDMENLIEVEENELGTYIDISQLDRSSTSSTETNQDDDMAGTIEIPDDLIVHDDDQKDKNDIIPPIQKITQQDNNDNNDDKGDVNSFLAFGALLKDKGVLPDVADEDISTVSSEEHLIDLINKQLGIVNNSWKENYKQNLLQNLVKDGYISEAQITKQLPKVPTLEEVDSNEEAAKNVIKTYYAEKDIPEAQIEKIIENTLDLVDEAKKLYPYIEEIKNSKQEEIARKLREKEEAELNQRNQFNDALKKGVYDYKEFIPGRTLKETDKEAVLNNVIPVLNKINANLTKYAPILSYLDKYNFLDGDMGKIFDELKTKQTSTFEKIITSKKRTNSANQPGTSEESGRNGGYSIYK